MTQTLDIVGKSYKLAGFEFYPEGKLTKIFAKFCGTDQDPANLPVMTYHPFFKRDMEAIYPSLSAATIGEIISGEAPGQRGAVIHAALYKDFTPEQWFQILQGMNKATAAYNEVRKQPVFIPVTTLG
jgi:hypothetical protein